MRKQLVSKQLAHRWASLGGRSQGVIPSPYAAVLSKQQAHVWAARCEPGWGHAYVPYLRLIHPRPAHPSHLYLCRWTGGKVRARLRRRLSTYFRHPVDHRDYVAVGSAAGIATGMYMGCCKLWAVLLPITFITECLLLTLDCSMNRKKGSGMLAGASLV